MKFRCFKLNLGQKELESTEFLSLNATEFLENCEDEIFHEWERRFRNPKDKSLANVMSATVLESLDEMRSIAKSVAENLFAVKRAFHHRSYAPGMFLEIFEGFNERGIRNWLIITQSSKFKEKFLYDSSTMTIETVVDDFLNFVHVLRLSSYPDIYFLVFDDLDFDTSVWQKGKKGYIKLHNDKYHRPKTEDD